MPRITKKDKWPAMIGLAIIAFSVVACNAPPYSSCGFSNAQVLQWIHDNGVNGSGPLQSCDDCSCPGGWDAEIPNNANVCLCDAAAGNTLHIYTVSGTVNWCNGHAVCFDDSTFTISAPGVSCYTQSEPPM